MTNDKTKSNRSAGILLHPTSLPGRFGIGDLGPAAYAWVDALVRAKQKLWQILPLGPTGFGDSPYQCFSSFAGNVYLISPEVLAQDGLVRQADLAVSFPADHVDFGPVIQFKLALLQRAWESFQSGSAAFLREPFNVFCVDHASWLNDYALFMALKESHGGASWLDWPADLVLRKPEALQKAGKELSRTVGRIQFGQYLFYRQWGYLKKYANEKGIKLIGDVPIFVSSDSADVWANPDFFLLDEKRRPTVVAGVPPDYFSATGQLWGNPLYNWEKLKQTGYVWWLQRLRAALAQVDLVRLDHFRGFEANWEVSANMPTAEIGRWSKGPGTDLFETLYRTLGHLPLIAEDLGVITPEVEALRDHFQLPGMRILQFAFGGAPEDRFLPHNYEHNTVVYTGTHDNDTTWGWYKTLTENEKSFLHRYLHGGGNDIAWELMRMAWGSVADYALAPLQDVLDLGHEARMNLPGRPSGNWSWRFTPQMLTEARLERLSDLTTVYARAP